MNYYHGSVFGLFDDRPQSFEQGPIQGSLLSTVQKSLLMDYRNHRVRDDSPSFTVCVLV